jgi:hypothetical protein
MILLIGLGDVASGPSFDKKRKETDNEERSFSAFLKEALVNFLLNDPKAVTFISSPCSA